MRQKTTVTRICPTCQTSFSFQLYNSPNRIFCSNSCKNRSPLQKQHSIENFIKKATVIHKNKFDYSKITVETYKARTDKKVEIICPMHGSFFQLPGDHIAGKGCKACANEANNLTQEEFLARAISVHGERYDYSLSVYKDYKTHVQIICLVHGSFWQSPSQHLWHKAGCEQCGKHVRISKGEKAWLNSLNIPEDDEYRQIYLTITGKVMVVDGYVAETNTVYEYFGDFWHGNPNVFKPEDFNSKCNTTFGNLYQLTQDRITLLKKNGYNVVSIWESEWQSVRG